MKDQGESVQTTVQHDQNIRSPLQQVTDEKVKEMKDQVIRAKAYLNFATSAGNTHLIKELKLRIKEVERALGGAKRDYDLSRSALQRMRNMEASLAKAGHIYNDCSAMATKLRAMTENAEEQVRAQKNQVNYLVHLAARTTPKGLHCLSMRLTTEYFSLQHEEREFPDQDKVNDPDLHHYAVFSDNVLACAVVVNSTISAAKDPEKIVFHVVTDSLNLPAISMWFLLNPPSKATIHVQSMDSFAGLRSSIPKLTRQNARDTRFTSPLNHLRFYLPDIFPQLNAIVLFDHDVVVQKDLTGLWNTEIKGKVIGAVETCQEGEPSFRQMDLFVNFSDPTVAERFDVKACTWAFGVNLFNLQEWRKRNLTAVYQKYLQMGAKRQLSVAGSLPMGWITFYNQTVALNKRWQVLGLGEDSEVAQQDVGKAAVIHYDGLMKPWLDIAIRKYKGYWSRHINYDNPYLRQCNIHPSS
ncbi:Glycosyl transferase, family 8 [Dillenia turbinata]|uniref:Hexosyltransferase n=1 Tax=Dillenia turbinata TaxID=194707 RepID=A0AAN8VVB9_9MAGN